MSISKCIQKISLQAELANDNAETEAMVAGLVAHTAVLLRAGQVPNLETTLDGLQNRPLSAASKSHLQDLASLMRGYEMPASVVRPIEQTALLRAAC